MNSTTKTWFGLKVQIIELVIANVCNFQKVSEFQQFSVVNLNLFSAQEIVVICKPHKSTLILRSFKRD